jgi:bifunctional non-homologous end joining protein LigD
VLRDDGVSDFQRLQNSMEAGRDVGCVYFAFDALFYDGFDLRELPLRERKELLREALASLDNPRVRFGDHVQGEGPAFFARACQHGLEGIVCKSADSRYTSGRSRAWLKVKCLMRQEFVVGGYTEPGGSRRHLGALLVGVREKDGGLSYAGKVGTGFTQASLAKLAERLAPLEQKRPPFANPPTGAERRGVHWVKPALVAEIAFMERTRDGLIRHASFQGLRDDKAAADVRLETPEPPREQSAARTTAPRAGAAAKTKRGATNERGAAARKNGAVTKQQEQPPVLQNGASRAARTRKPAPALAIDPSQVEITHPDRVLYPDQGITKRELMLHYARVARWMLPQIVERPLMLVRCPEGTERQCFHQKHPSRGMPKAVLEVKVREKRGLEAHLMIRSVEGLLGLVQMGALEIHAWGCRAGQLDCPDQLVFDLDPGEGVPWQRVLEGATTLRARLEQLGLTGFPRATGGKGLHVVVPVTPTTEWAAAKAFTKRFAEAMVRDEPDRYLATMAKRERKGKIFIDYLRNGSGATAIASYSTRARAGAPIATPLSWDELTDDLRPERFTVKNFERRLADYVDPWASFDEARAPIPT